MPNTYQQQAGGEEDPAHLEAAQHTAVPRRAVADHGHNVTAEPLNACGTRGHSQPPSPAGLCARHPQPLCPPQDIRMVLGAERPPMWVGSAETASQDAGKITAQLCSMEPLSSTPWSPPSSAPWSPPPPLTIAGGDADAHEEGNDDQPEAGAVGVNEGEPEDATL